MVVLSRSAWSTTSGSDGGSGCSTSATLLLLLATLLIGSGGEEVGAKRWIDLPFLRLQSSELAKVLLIVCLGSLLADGVELRHRFRFVLLAVGYVVVPAVLIFLEPDLGTALVFGAILAAMLLVWGIRWLHLGVLTAGVGVVVVVRVAGVADDLRHQPAQALPDAAAPRLPRSRARPHGGRATSSRRARSPSPAACSAARGSCSGTQTHLNFLPAHHTDFIFAVIGEELGFAGAALLLALYAVVIWRAFRIASTAKNLYGTLIASGIIAVLLFQVFLNVGMTIGILPGHRGTVALRQLRQQFAGDILDDRRAAGERPRAFAHPALWGETQRRAVWRLDGRFIPRRCGTLGTK